MFLRELTKSGSITISYYQKGIVKSCKGRVCELNLNEQTIYLKDQKKKIYPILLSSIKAIH